MIRLHPNSDQLKEVNHCHGKGKGHPCEGGASKAKTSNAPEQLTRQQFQEKFVTHGTTAALADIITKEGITSGFASSPVPYVTYNGRVVPMAIAHKFGDKILIFKRSAIDKGNDQFTLKEGVKPLFVVDAGRPEHLQLVERAIAAGKTVPPNVLADYPELVKK